MAEDSISPFDAIKRVDAQGEYWSGRMLMPLMQYGRWHEFTEVIEKAKASLALVEGNEQAQHHFVIQHTDGGRWGNQQLIDYRLTRFGAYLTAMAGDDTKEAVAQARIYFAVKAREAEVSQVQHELPASYAQALRELAATVEECEAVKVALASAEPKADAWDVLASAKGDYSVREAANILNRDPDISTGQKRLFKLLRDMGLLDAGNVPYARHAHHVCLRATKWTDRNLGFDRASDQVRVTAEGLRYLRKRLHEAVIAETGQPALFQVEAA
jgi:DNA-damage-inducible protein D